MAVSIGEAWTAIALPKRGEQMEDQKDHPIDQAIRKSHIREAYFTIGMGMLVLLTCLIFPSLFHDSGSISIILLIIMWILVLVMGWMTYLEAKQVHIVTSVDGITYYSPGLEVRSPWENVDKIRSMSILFGWRKLDFLLLHQPAEEESTWWYRLWRGKPDNEISLSMFGNWRESELGQEIMKYAPHLDG
jgi:hypothetical protein